MKKLYKPKEWKVSYDAELDEMFVGVLPQPKGKNYYRYEKSRKRCWIHGRWYQ